MAFTISAIIGIRTGGVFSDETDTGDLKERILRVIKKMGEEGMPCDITPENLSQCISNELVATKGSYVVIAGVFNYWTYENGISEFAKRLSKEFGVEVMAMTCEDQTDPIHSCVFLDGKSLNEVNENTINRTLRRTV